MVAWMPTSAVPPVTRLSADERREAVLDAAVHEFAQAGYHAASTTSIARRAGISQPYIYALFPNKKALFIGCQERASNRIRDAFLAAAEGAKDVEDRIERMGDAYKRLLDDRDELLCQLHGFAAAGDPEIREPVAACFRETFDTIANLVGGAPEEARAFVAMGMYLNIARALELPKDYTGED
jgi:AcrR family transcriptional regulator